jgi:magnesium chelatase family protein
MNPCPCGYFPDRSRCKCTPLEINSYLNRISQPLLDRIDLCVECPAVSIDELVQGSPSGRSSSEIRAEVMRAVAIQKERFKDAGFHFNSEIPSSLIGEFCPMEESAEMFLRKAFDKLGLTARSYFRIIRVARTIADLAGADLILKEHISEAVSYRTVDKKYRAV